MGQATLHTATILGRLAANAELRAARTHVEPWAREALLRQAQGYRSAQQDMMAELAREAK